MILAYPVATPEIKKKYMGLLGDFEKNILALKRVGFNAVELFTCSPDSIDTKAVKSLLHKYEMEVASVATSHLFNQDGLSLLGPHQEIYDAAMKRMRIVILFASQFKAPVSIGKFRGNMSEPRNHNEWGKFTEALRAICAFAAEQGIDILIEPQNRTTINNINSVTEACTLTEEVKQPNLRLHLDTFHLDLSEDDPAGSILTAREKIGFFHLSDSDRKIPGEGNIDLPAIFQVLSTHSYGGYLSFEIKQGDTPLVTAQKAFSETAKILNSLA